jgi:hypothetical protein
LVGRCQQPALHCLGDEVDLAAVDVVVARHEQQAIAPQTFGQCRPKLALEPFPGELVLLGFSGKRQITAEDHQVRRQPLLLDISLDETRQCTQHRIGVPSFRGPKVDIRQMKDSNRLVCVSRRHRLAHLAVLLQCTRRVALGMARRKAARWQEG